MVTWVVRVALRVLLGRSSFFVFKNDRAKIGAGYMLKGVASMIRKQTGLCHGVLATLFPHSRPSQWDPSICHVSAKVAFSLDCMYSTDAEDIYLQYNIKLTIHGVGTAGYLCARGSGIAPGTIELEQAVGDEAPACFER